MVEDALALSPDLVISIENFDTFVWITSDYLRSKLIGQLSVESVMLIYRGDNKALPSAVKSLREEYKGPWWHFGDFDPQGILIAITGMGADAIIVPLQNELSSLLEHAPYINNSENYHIQQNALASLEKLSNNLPVLAEMLSYIVPRHLAICQEPITSRNLNLQVLSIK
jgi:hypothetical protein